MAERPDQLDALVTAALEILPVLGRKAARYDWLAQGGIYRIGFDSTGGVSLEQWDSVIDELMDREDGR